MRAFALIVNREALLELRDRRRSERARQVRDAMDQLWNCRELRVYKAGENNKADEYLRTQYREPLAAIDKCMHGNRSCGVAVEASLTSLELHRWRVADRRLVTHGKRRFYLEAEHFRGEIDGKAAHIDVVILH